VGRGGVSKLTGVNRRPYSLSSMMEIKQFMNGIKVYTPVAISKLYEYQNRLDRCKKIRIRLVKSEKVHRINRYINGK
jgi:hypothetical protein